LSKISNINEVQNTARFRTYKQEMLNKTNDAQEI